MSVAAPMKATGLVSLLEPPRYGFERSGRFYRPSRGELWAEFFHRLDPRRGRHAWLGLLSWSIVLVLGAALGLFLLRYFSWPLLALGFGISRLTHRSPLYTAVRQLLLGALAAAVTYGAGTLLGATLWRGRKSDREPARLDGCRS